MRTYSKIENDLFKLESEKSEERAKLMREAVERMTKDLDKNTELESLLAKLESSRELTSDGEFPARWIRFSASDFINTDSKLERDAFEEYLHIRHFCTVDFKNDCLIMSDGPCILINDDGDIFDQDSGKFIIPVDDTRDEDGKISVPKRNQLIEQWMDKSGYFPSVVREDRYGNMFYVNLKDGE